MVKTRVLRNKQDLLDLCKALSSRTNLNRHLDEDGNDLTRPLIVYLVNARMREESAQADLKEIDLGPIKSVDDLLSGKNLCIFEQFRFWYEVRRDRPKSYYRFIQPLGIHWKLFALYAFLLLWFRDHDVRHLNFCIKLVEDIYRGTVDMGDQEFLKYFARYTRDVTGEVEELYEKFAAA